LSNRFRMTVSSNGELEKNKDFIRYFLEKLLDSDVEALCVVESGNSKWACGSKKLLNKLSSGNLRTQPDDRLEEIYHGDEDEELQKDEEVFDSDHLFDSEWKFSGGGAFLISSDEIRKRKFAHGVPLSSLELKPKTPKVAKSESSNNEDEEDISIKPFVCNRCTCGFSTKDELKNHLCNYADPKPFHCDICMKGFSTKSNMQRHRNIHTKEKVFQCTHCNKKFYDSGNLKRHIEGVHSTKDVTREGDDIDVTLESISESTFSQQNETLPSDNESSRSPSSKFNDMSMEDAEEEEEIDTKPVEGETFNCDKCLLRTNKKSEMLEHLKTAHSGDGNQHCVRVEQPLSEASSIEGASDAQKSFNYKLFFCDFCWKEFTWRANLVRHINIHTHAKSFFCSFSLCKKSFSSHTSLRRHEQKHQGVHYKCSKCVRLFNDPSNLRRHEASCTGSGDAADNPVDEKPSTSEKAMPNVKVEKKSESKEEVDQMKPHRCGYCKKSFGRAERLEEHLRTHTGETPFTCDICGKGFTTKHNLIRHRNIHTLEKKYTCKYCNKFFADPTQHKRHQATHLARGAQVKRTVKGSKKSEMDVPLSLVIPNFS